MAYWEQLRQLRERHLSTVVELLTREPALAPGGAIHHVRVNIEQLRLVLEQEERAGAVPLVPLENLRLMQELFEKFWAAVRRARAEVEAFHAESPPLWADANFQAAAGRAAAADVAQAVPAVAVPVQMQVIALPLNPGWNATEAVKMYFDFQRDLIRQGFTYARTERGGQIFYERPMPAHGDTQVD
jgi:hypothetical protein